jgi:cysteine-rich repeat protein
MKRRWKWVSLFGIWLVTLGCNQIIDAGAPEVVDDANDDQDGDPAPAQEAYCGDGVTGADEQCDDANDEPSDGCHKCQLGCGPYPEALSLQNGSCYRFELVVKKSWAAAEADCEAWQGKLTAITTLDELGFAQQHLESDTWVGGTIPSGSTSPQWVTGEAWTLDVETTFVTEPVASGHETCVLMDGEKLAFRLEECVTSAGYICERPYVEVE